jgi:hypothetical protein
MTDIVDLSEHKRAQASVDTDGGGPCDPMTGTALDDILEGVLATRTNADEICNDIVLAAGLLEIFAIECSDPHHTQSEAEIGRQWHQVEYVARQLLRHASDLGDALDALESGVFAAKRATKDAEDEEGDAA